MELLDQLMGQFGPSTIEALSKQIGASPEQTKNAVDGALPSMLGAMRSNAGSTKGAKGLLAALDRDHDGSILDDIGGFIGKGDTSGGAGILKHVLGKQEGAVSQRLGEKSGLSASQMANLMKLIAPIVMGYLGKKKRSSGFDIGDIGNVLGELTSGADKATGIDLSDVFDMVGGLSGGKRSGGIGGLLGKLFSK